jgi:hypothetical protein
VIPRFLHQAYAALAGYGWVPCPLCGREFGGHEWRDRNGNTSHISHPSKPGTFKAICPDCTRAGRGWDDGTFVNGTPDEAEALGLTADARRMREVCDTGADLEVTDPHEIGTAHNCPEGCATHNPGGPDVPRDVPQELYDAAQETATFREGHASECMWFVSDVECSCHVWPAARAGVDTAWDTLRGDALSVPRDALRRLVEAAMWVSRGKSMAFTPDDSKAVGKTYPDAKARLALGALDDAGLLDQSREDSDE